jgi:hypothetical protein
MFVGGFVVIANFYGFLMTWKHYERAHQCAKKASAYRKVVSELISTPAQNVETIRKQVEGEHEANRNMLLAKVRAHYLWSGLHLIIVIIGAAIFVNGYCS